MKVRPSHGLQDPRPVVQREVLQGQLLLPVVKPDIDMMEPDPVPFPSRAFELRALHAQALRVTEVTPGLNGQHRGHMPIPTDGAKSSLDGFDRESGFPGAFGRDCIRGEVFGVQKRP